MNNIGLYVRQAWTMIRQQKLFSGIYIAGTGLSIALVMILFIVIYVKTAPLYPEYKRDRTLSIQSVAKSLRDTTVVARRTSLASYKLYGRLENMPHLEAIGATKLNWISADEASYMETDDSQDMIPVFPLYVEDGYWKVFDFEFINGKPFTRADFEAHARLTILSQSFAKRVFATDDVVGKRFFMEGNEFNVCGVVKDVPSAMSNFTTADMWLPYSVSPDGGYDDCESYLGDLNLLLVAKSADDVEALKADVAEVMRKINLEEEKTEYRYDIMLGPDLYVNDIFKDNTADGFDYSYKFLYILIALIFIPAFNLSGLVSSKMNKRLPELGIRKTYGASNSALMSQVLWENLLLTALGGVLGLILCIVVVFIAQDWILAMFSTAFEFNVTLTGSRLSAEMLFNWQVFTVTLLLCFVLNIISALIPVGVSLRKNIIESLNYKK